MIPQIGETVSKEQFKSLYPVGTTLPSGEFQKLYPTPEQPTQQPTGKISFLERLKLGFGGEKAKAEQQRLETEAGLKGKLDIGDIADVAGASIPLIGSILGGFGGAIGGVGVGAIPGAAIGAVAGESAKQAIGRALGVREEVPLTKEMKSLAFTGAATYLGGKVIGKVGKYVLSRVPKLFGIFAGESPEVVENALKNPKIADKAIQQGDEVLRNAIRVGAKKTIQLKNDLISGFKNTLSNFTKTLPKKLQISFSNRNEVKTILSNILKAKGVKIKGNTLDFSISPIKANPGEISKINVTWETLNKWKDFSFKGTQELKRLVGSLTKFADEAGIPSKSPSLGSFYHSIKELTLKKLPKPLSTKFSNINKHFENNIDMFDDLVDAFNKGDPFTKIAQAMGKNKDTLRMLLEAYEKKTGESIISILAGRQLGAERQAAFGFLNPREWIDLIVSPKAQARVITKYGKGIQMIPQKIREAVPKAISVQTVPFLKFLKEK